MIGGKGLDICLLGFLILCAGCTSLSRTTPPPGLPDDLPGCYAVFPSGPWESVHRIEATIKGGGSFSALGVTKGEPSERWLQSILLTPEGFILFDAESRKGTVTVQKAVVPFDSPAFARGLLEDVAFLFLPPQGKPTTWGKKADGTTTCKWEGPGDSSTEVTGSMDRGWRILRRDKSGRVTEEVVLNGPFVNGLASRLEVHASKPASYKLRMTLVEPPP